VKLTLMGKNYDVNVIERDLNNKNRKNGEE
jgi:hypothetical protein